MKGKHMTLLEKALAIPPKPKSKLNPTSEELDLSLALLSGTITGFQFKEAVGAKFQSVVYSKALGCLRRAHIAGLITVTRNGAAK